MSETTNFWSFTKVWIWQHCLKSKQIIYGSKQIMIITLSKHKFSSLLTNKRLMSNNISLILNVDMNIFWTKFGNSDHCGFLKTLMKNASQKIVVLRIVDRIGGLRDIPIRMCTLYNVAPDF